MRKAIELKPHLSIEEIKERLYHSCNGHHASYWQIILSLSNYPGKTTLEYCNYLGVSDSKLYRIVALYNQQGSGFCDALMWGGRREKRSLMSFAQEEQLLSEAFSTGIQGEVLVAKHLRHLVEQKLSKSVSDDYLRDLLNRHDWSKKAPRPEHPKGHDKDNDTKKEEFKKKAPELFQSITEGKRVKVFFEDEARFGRINNVSRCRVPPHHRAHVKQQMVREHIYAFTAVCPLTG